MVPFKKDDGTEIVRAVFAQGNMWASNNCCGALDFSAFKAFSYGIESSPWSNRNHERTNVFTFGQRDCDEVDPDQRDTPFSPRRLRDQKRSPLPHVREFDSTFPAFEDTWHAEAWISGVLCYGLLGMMSYTQRNLARAVDCEEGALSDVLQYLPAVGASLKQDHRGFYPVLIGHNRNLKHNDPRNHLSGHTRRYESDFHNHRAELIETSRLTYNQNSGACIYGITVAVDTPENDRARYDLNQSSYSFASQPTLQDLRYRISNLINAAESRPYCWAVPTYHVHY
jgi:hypothetical protein